MENEHDYQLEKSLLYMFLQARNERFEDGMWSNFARLLIEFIETHGDKSIKMIADVISYQNINSDVVVEALKTLARVEDTATHEQRRQLIESCLECGDFYVRDGATIALDLMDDPAAIPSIEKAIAREGIEELRDYMKSTLEQLSSAGNS